jgi:hypothetical protein
MTRTQRARLSAFIERKHRVRRHARTSTSPNLEPAASVGFHFSPQRHRLTIEQCRLATQLLRRANQQRPIRGASRQATFRRALRIAGIVSAVRQGRVGNRRWGRAMKGRKGGNIMRDHGPHILAANRRRIQERRQALRAWEEHQVTQTPLQQQIEAWTQQQWQLKNALAW